MEDRDLAQGQPELVREEPPTGAPPGGVGELRTRILDALKVVNDPELGINIVDLGLVYDVDIEDGRVRISYTLTTMGCPIGPMIEAQMKEALAEVDGVEEVESELTLSPPWTPEQMSEEAKAALGMF